MSVRLTELSSDGLYGILRQIDDLRLTVDVLGEALARNAINGRVLMHCDLGELKSVSECLLLSNHSKFELMLFRFSPAQILNLNFGNWEIFRQLVTGLREIERNQRFAGSDQTSAVAFADAMDNFVAPVNLPRKKSVMEKQVILGETIEQIQLVASSVSVLTIE